MIISEKYTNPSKKAADTTGNEAKKIELQENDYLFAELLANIEEELRKP